MNKRFVSENGIRANFYQNDSDPSRVIILLGGSNGGIPFTDSEETVQHFLDIGYSVLCLAYFAYEGLPPTLQCIPLEYFENVIKWLSKQPNTVIDNFSIMGFSKGAELTLLLASLYSQLTKIAAIVPSNVVWQGIPIHPRFNEKHKLVWDKQYKNNEPLPKLSSSWSYLGTDIPFVPFPHFSILDIFSRFTLHFRGMYLRGLKNKKALAYSTIPIEKANGDILLISGVNDTMWPSTIMSNQAIKRLQEHSYKFTYNHIELQTDHNPTIDPQFWSTVLDFFKL
jgi:hypothetical protein